MGSAGSQGAEFHAWLTRWFNAWTDLTPDDPAAFAREFLDDGLPYGDGFAETLFYCHPRSDADSGAWVFDRTVMRVLTVEGLRRPPAIGHVTGETRRGDAVNAVLDQLPEGTVYVTTLVPVPQDTVDAHVDRIASSATGEAAEALRAQADCRTAKEIMGERQKLYRLGLAFYLRAPSVQELDARTAEARTVLLRHGFRAIAPKDDVRALDNFLLHLPMAYEPDIDRLAGWRQTRLAWVQHAANVWPVFGRSTGTGHPGLSFFNRGGEPLMFDPLNKLDRLKNAHGLLVGPTGAGKERDARRHAGAADGRAPAAALRDRGRQLVRAARGLVRVAGPDRQPRGAETRQRGVAADLRRRGTPARGRGHRGRHRDAGGRGAARTRRRRRRRRGRAARHPRASSRPSPRSWSPAARPARSNACAGPTGG